MQLLGSAMGYNRYAYCLNNPLLFTDPDGEFAFLAVGLFLGLMYLKTAHDNRDMETGKWDWSLRRTFSKESQSHFEIGINNQGGHMNFTVRYNGQQVLNTYESRVMRAEQRAAGIVDEAHADASAEALARTNFNRNSYSTYDEIFWQNSFTQMENIGMNGGFFVRLSGSRSVINGNEYSSLYVSARAPAAEKFNDRLDYFAKYALYQNGKRISQVNSFIPSQNGMIRPIDSYTYIGSANFLVPNSGNFSVQIYVSYNVFQLWNGFAYPRSPFNRMVKYER
jgi:hypothetical protein